MLGHKRYRNGLLVVRSDTDLLSDVASDLCPLLREKPRKEIERLLEAARPRVAAGTLGTAWHRGDSGFMCDMDPSR